MQQDVQIIWVYLKELTVQLVIFYENEITKEDDQSRLLENKIEAPFRTDTLRCISAGIIIQYLMRRLNLIYSKGLI